MSPSPPLLGRVQDKQAAQAPSRLGLKNGVLSQGQFPALCRHFLSKPGRVKGTMLGLISPSKQENEVFIGIHWGGAFPWMPTFLKGANSKAEGYPGEQVQQQKDMEEQEAGHFGISKANT